MRRLFSMFPQGAPGSALLLLRISVATMLLTGGMALLPDWTVPGLALLALLLCFGLLTVALAVLCCLIETAALVWMTGVDVPIAVIAILNAAALALLGPGAYSLDARLFGRRLLTLPPGRNSDRR